MWISNVIQTFKLVHIAPAEAHDGFLFESFDKLERIKIISHIDCQNQ